MLKNNNQAITRKISKRFMHKNKMRNRITILAIILMTFMFTTVFSIGFSMAKNMNTMLIRQAGTTAEISLANPAPEQIDEIKKCSALSAAGVTIPVCKAKSEEDQDLNFKLIYHDKENFNGNIKPALSSLKGNYPDEKNEIMLSVSGLNAIGIKSPEIGMDIPLMLKNEEQIFKLSGYFVDYGFRTNNYDAFVSEKFSDSLGLTAEQDGLISISSKSFLQNILYDQLYKSVKLNQGQEFECTFDNNENNGIVIAAAVLFICLIIIISGYLLIYNIMYISVNHDIRFYGLLKTIGTTSKQIRSIVKYQSLSLSVIGIPIGILIGTIVSFKAVPYSISMFGGDFYSAMPTDISFNPLIYIGTILFALLTILISCRKPAKFAGSISPIEALKYNGQNNCKIRSRKATNGGKIYKMAYRNIFREKKRTVLVFASLLMGVIALLSTQTFLNSLDLKNYADYYLPNDFVIYTDCSSEEDFEVKDNEKTEASIKLADDIRKIKGITEVMTNTSADISLVYDKETFEPFLKEAAERDGSNSDDIAKIYEEQKNNLKYNAPILGIDAAMMEMHNTKAKKKVDIDKFEKGEICFIGYINDKTKAAQMEGKVITLINEKTGRKKDINVGVCASGDDNALLEIGYYWCTVGAPECVLVSQSVINELSDSPHVETIIANCSPENEESVHMQIKQLTQHNISIPSVAHIQIKSEELEEFRSSILSMRIMTSGICAILILIGIINFINVMLTGIFTRRNELAVMESIGMTKKQVRKMLIFEGFYYALITDSLILTLGSGIVYIFGKLSLKIADYAIFSYPWQLIICISLIILIICILVPAAVYRMVAKNSVTDRLRSTE